MRKKIGLGLTFILVFLIIAFSGCAQEEGLDSSTETDEVSVNIIADFGDDVTKEWYDVKVPKDSTVFEAMEASGMIFDYEVSSWGIFITSIEGVAQRESAGIYWTYTINGEFAELGIADITVTDDMMIEWKYSKFE